MTALTWARRLLRRGAWRGRLVGNGRRAATLGGVIRQRLQLVLVEAGGQDQRLAVAALLEVAPLDGNVLGTDAKEAADRDNHRLDGALAVEIEVLHRADGVLVLVA